MSKKIQVKKLQNTPYVIAPQQIIGKGSFAIIVKAYNTQNLKQQLVSKIISVKDIDTSQTIRTQLQILKKLPYHINLVNCMKVQISSQNNFYLIMQYCNEGNLEKFMFRRKFNINEQKIWFFLKQFCQGYKVLYNNGVVHRDIKPDNILIHNGDFKIADFGLSKNVQNTQYIENMSAKGTPLYMAPQLHKNKQGSSKVDVFSLGVVLYRMAFGGEYPFFDQGRKYRSINDYFKQLMIRKLEIPKNHKRSKILVNLIQQMLVKDKQKRIGWKQIFQIQQIKNAIRFQRKKQLAPMDQMSRSLRIMNSSQTEFKIIQNPQTNQNFNNQQSKNITLQQTFSKNNKSKFQKILFKNKLLYTLIEYTNTKIKVYIKKASSETKQNIKINNINKLQKISQYLQKKMYKINQLGILFSLFVITRLAQISGDWSELHQGEINNFQDIFENDKLIFLEQYEQIKKNKKVKINNKQSKENKKQEQNKQPQYIPGTYQDALYNVLSQFFQYPSQIRTQMRSIFALLVEIYDLAIKIDTKLEDQEKNIVEKVQDQTPVEFYQYLIEIQTIQQKVLKEQMKKKGLIFL